MHRHGLCSVFSIWTPLAWGSFHFSLAVTADKSGPIRNPCLRASSLPVEASGFSCYAASRWQLEVPTCDPSCRPSWWVLLWVFPVISWVVCCSSVMNRALPALSAGKDLLSSLPLCPLPWYRAGLWNSANQFTLDIFSTGNKSICSHLWWLRDVPELELVPTPGNPSVVLDKASCALCTSGVWLEEKSWPSKFCLLF